MQAAERPAIAAALTGLSRCLQAQKAGFPAATATCPSPKLFFCSLEWWGLPSLIGSIPGDVDALNPFRRRKHSKRHR